jgi:nucleotide-binding universal stress UspA family protein
VYKRQQSADLLPFEEVKQKLDLHISRDRGLQQVPLDKIVGSVGKYRDFTRAFWPKQEKLRERWKWIYVAAHSFRGLPPVELYQVGDVYFVKDGNHRISVARELGNRTIEASVTEFISPVPLTVDTLDTDLDALVLALEREEFLQRTRILELRPAATLEVSEVGGYRRLQEHMAVPGYVLSQEQQRDLSWEEAVAIWYDDVYLPVVATIHEHGLHDSFPASTDADLYLWLMENRSYLEQGAEKEAAVAAAARTFVEKYTPRLQWIWETRPAPGQWRLDRVEPRGDDRLFAEVLVPIAGDPAAWQLVDHALALAAREQGRLHALFAGQAPADHLAAAPLLERFAAACTAAAIPWRFRAETGGGLQDAYANSRGYDLVILSLEQLQTAQHDQLMGSEIQGVIRRVICPVLALSPSRPRLSRALLAYDGSPYSEEALYVAAYLGRRWDMPVTVVTVEESPRTTPAILENALTYLKQQQVHSRGFFKSPDPLVKDSTIAVARTILKTAEDQGCDLIVLGDTGYSPFVELFVRSTVDGILREARCSVLVIA